jgi:hypothetical protein
VDQFARTSFPRCWYCWLFPRISAHLCCIIEPRNSTNFDQLQEAPHTRARTRKDKRNIGYLHHVEVFSSAHSVRWRVNGCFPVVRGTQGIFGSQSSSSYYRILLQQFAKRRDSSKRLCYNFTTCIIQAQNPLVIYLHYTKCLFSFYTKTTEGPVKL